MNSADRSGSITDVSPEAAGDMAKFGITRIPVDYFHYGDYRYTNLKDAVAQAKREQTKSA